MAEPVLTATLLTPISIRLTWTYTGAADFEVFWKSDHPAGQEYAPLGRTSGLTYDVGSLSWTTTYYFKVRAVSGSTYGDFSNAIEIFVCCGQAVLYDSPGETTVPYLTYWQQSGDIENGKVAMICKRYDESGINGFYHYNGQWFSIGTKDYVNTLNNYPAGVRLVNNKIAIFDLYTANDMRFYIYDIETEVWSDPVIWTFADATKLRDDNVYNEIEYNEDGRIVLGYRYHSISANHSHYYALVSDDHGVTWGSPVELYSSIATPWTPMAVGAMAEDGNKVIWVVTSDRNPDSLSLGTAEYKVISWVPGDSPSIVRTITTTMQGTASYIVYGASCSIYAEGSKIVIYYIDSVTNTGGYSLKPTYKVDISDDYGATWETKSVVLDGVTNLFRGAFIGPVDSVCVANGNIIIQVNRGTDGDDTRPYLYASYDNGDTWELVLDNSSITADEFYHWGTLRSDGEMVIWMGCGGTPNAESLGFYQSNDSGSTWSGLSSTFTPPPTILVPA